MRDFSNLKLKRNTKLPDIDYSVLSDDQQDILEQILQALRNGNKKIILSGSAGTGKTFLVKYLINKYYHEAKTGQFAYITAPTNRAVSVLQEKDDDDNWWMNFSTVHKALYMKRKIDNKTGEISFKPDYKPKYETPFKQGFIIVVDEASMLNSEILYYLENHEYSHIPMIFLGDIKQLNPVNEPESPIFKRPDLSGQTIDIRLNNEIIKHEVPDYVQFKLTKIIRQAEGNPIIHISRNLHEIGLMNESLNADGYGYSYTSDYDRCLNEVCFDTDKRFLAWTNYEVDKFNDRARKLLWDNPSKVMKNETIIFSQPYNGTTQTFYNNQELKVEKLNIVESDFTALKEFNPDGTEDEVTIREKLTYYLINDEVKIIHEESEGDFKLIQRQLAELTKRGLKWQAWYDFTETFAQFSYRYATTVHKAQGGTFDTVFINMRDVNRNFNKVERKRLWYTAVTRAAKNVVFYNHRTY